MSLKLRQMNTVALRFGAAASAAEKPLPLGNLLHKRAEANASPPRVRWLSAEWEPILAGQVSRALEQPLDRLQARYLYDAEADCITAARVLAWRGEQALDVPYDWTTSFPLAELQTELRAQLREQLER